MDQYESLIDDIYLAAARPASWKRVLQNIARATNATDSLLQAMSWQNGNTIPEFLVAANIGSTDIAHHGELVAHTGDPRFKAGFVLSLGQTFLDHHFITKAAMDQHPYYNELLLPLDMWHVAAVPTIRTKGEQSTLCIGFSIQISRSQGPLAGRNKQVWHHLVPHMVRSIRLAHRLQTLDSLRADSPHSDRAGFVLDHMGRVLSFNASAENLLASGFVTIDRDLRLQIADRKLHARVTRALLGELSGNRDTPLTDSVPDLNSNGTVVWTFGLTPLPRGENEHRPNQLAQAVAELVLFRESPSTGTSILSPAEIRLVKYLSTGATLRSSATELGVRYETVRSQCKSAMRKYDVRTRVSLVNRWLKEQAVDLR